MPRDEEIPELTVLMAVHNGSLYLRTAIDSILQQTYQNFRFLIVDDASTDDTCEIVRSYRDDRIDLECLDHNIGQTAALNIGLNLATTPWIARMDADDYSAPTRFEKQMQALEKDHSIKCLGTHVWIFHNDPENIDSVLETPEAHADIKRALLRGSSIVHGSIVVDRAAMLDVGGFDERYRVTSDLELYDRLASKYVTANIPIQLTGIRQHRGQKSRSKLAYDEAIDICARRLMSGNYSKKEAFIIRATLSRCFLYRAQFGGEGIGLTERYKDLLRAVRVSPSTFFWNFSVIYLFSKFSDNRHTTLQRVLARLVPKFLTGR